MLKKFLLEIPEGLRIDWKVQSALRGFTMNEYATLALDIQIEKDKSKLKSKEEDKE